MRDKLKVQELMGLHLDSMAEESQQLHFQSQEDGARMAAVLLQLQELISLVEGRVKTVRTNLEEVK